MIDPMGVWYNILRLAGRRMADQDPLVLLCRAILHETDQADKREPWMQFGNASREEWDEILGEDAYNDEAGRPRRRALNAFFARLNAAGMTNDRLFFLCQFSDLIEGDSPADRFDNAWHAEQREHHEDYFRLACTWMKEQFDVEPNVVISRWKKDHTYTEERWNGLETEIDGYQ